MPLLVTDEIDVCFNDNQAGLSSGVGSEGFLLASSARDSKGDSSTGNNAGDLLVCVREEVHRFKRSTVGLITMTCQNMSVYLGISRE